VYIQSETNSSPAKMAAVINSLLSGVVDTPKNNEKL